jgi:hypothetical protein
VAPEDALVAAAGARAVSEEAVQRLTDAALALPAATTAPGVVIALLAPGPARRRLLAVAVRLVGATAVSRMFLNAHRT